MFYVCFNNLVLDIWNAVSVAVCTFFYNSNIGNEDVVFVPPCTTSAMENQQLYTARHFQQTVTMSVVTLAITSDPGIMCKELAKYALCFC